METRLETTERLSAMKRTLGLILTAVFLSVLSIPCAAAGTGRGCPGFSDAAEGEAPYEAVKLCCERGLMRGTSETTFSPRGKLSAAQPAVPAARLYDLQNGGDAILRLCRVSEAAAIFRCCGVIQSEIQSIPSLRRGRTTVPYGKSKEKAVHHEYFFISLLQRTRRRL